MKITVIGAGAWGTALARVLHQNQHEITLWGHDAERLAIVQKSGRNERYLPGIDLPRDWNFSTDLSQAAVGAECVVIAVPSKAFRDAVTPLSAFRGIAVSVTKGIEYDTGLTMSGILREVMPNASPSVLSGPTLAMEVARGIPAAIVAASGDEKVAQKLQELFHRPTFRVYTTDDLLGVELGGALKNVIAIAAGTSDGLGFGDSSKAALLTRAIVEMRRIGTACGAHPETFSGLSGLGDLTVTCFSRLSRNRGMGEQLGRGAKLEELLANSVTVAEGYPTSRAAYRLARTLKLQTPIIDEVYAMLYEGKNLGRAVLDLMSRDSKAED